MRWMTNRIRRWRGRRAALRGAGRAAAAARRWLPAALAAAGVGLIAWGLGMMYAPLAPVCVGAAMLLEVLSTRGGAE